MLKFKKTLAAASTAVLIVAASPSALAEQGPAPAPAPAPAPSSSLGDGIVNGLQELIRIPGVGEALRDTFFVVVGIPAMLSSMGSSMLSIPQCGLFDTRAC
ncbi:hypothetical protein [Corynebacterium sp.]|uniref:hypothetical protein n=1 Tax=Corynebacterium sp. TaxID=1720 RepID=UPI0026DCBA94|nr:hypothetical protein [Corynebacterium sp.]MDO5031121.1 hypothetical protein [Corynebacterium sp.]